MSSAKLLAIATSSFHLSLALPACNIVLSTILAHCSSVLSYDKSYHISSIETKSALAPAILIVYFLVAIFVGFSVSELGADKFPVDDILDKNT